MPVPETVKFRVRTDKRTGVVLGVGQCEDAFFGERPPLADPLQILNLPRTPYGDWSDGEVLNVPFEAIIYFDTVSTNSKGRGLDVKIADKDIWYSMLPVDLLDVIHRGQIINSYARGQWQVVKRSAGYSLSMIHPLPFPSFGEGE